jgi:hypothetical protein
MKSNRTVSAHARLQKILRYFVVCFIPNHGPSKNAIKYSIPVFRVCQWQDISRKNKDRLLPDPML